MTFVGKIFVVLIFVMSLVFMSFAVVVYATHRNWYAVVENSRTDRPPGLKVQLEDKKREVEAALAVRQKIEAEVADEKSARIREVAKLTTLVEELKQQRDELQKNEAKNKQDVADSVAARGDLRLVGAMTHFATADDDPAFLAEQLAVFTPWAEALKAAHPELLVHAANSAATLREPNSMYKIVFGCVLLTVSYVVIAYASWQGGHAQISWLWLGLYFAIITTGEIFLSPPYSISRRLIDGWLAQERSV